MAAIYTYLISSLPMLAFGGKPAFTREKFLQQCRDLIPEKDLHILEICFSETFFEQELKHPLLKKWLKFETGLRNELVKIRSIWMKIDPAKYLRRDGYGESELFHVAMNSHRIISLAQAEKFLDQQRWLKLEELAFGHYFDLEALIIYCLKLRILWRWENIVQAEKVQRLERVLSAIQE